MNLAIIGRSQVLYSCAEELHRKGHRIKLVITSKAAPEYSVEANDFKRLSDELGAKFISSPKITASEIIELFQDIGQIDLAVSINYTGIISQEVIDQFPLGILNVHGGDLPRYRGNACQAWAILNGENKIGLCIHKMIGGELDSGDIIAREYIEIGMNTTIGRVYEWIEKVTPKMMVAAIEKLEQSPSYILEQQSRDPGKALRCYPRRPDDGKIDWSRSAEEILRLVNASSEPYSGAFTSFDEKKCIIWKAELFSDSENWLGVPGQVASIENDGSAIILTGMGKIRITEIELNKGDRVVPKEVIGSIRSRFQ